MPYFILYLFFLLQSLLLLTAARQTELIDALNIQTREMTTKQLATAIDSVYVESGYYPTSFAALAALPGYEYLKNTSRPFQSMAVATNILDPDFKFSRVAVFSQDPYDYPLPDAIYLAATNNACGAGDFATSTTWCGSQRSNWWKHETREIISANIARERNRQRRLLDKFTSWYSTSTGNNIYPDPGAAAAALSALVAGFAQTATTCTGIYTWQGIPIDCTDLYSIWGTPTVYNYLSRTHVALLTKTPYIKADGTPLYISTEISL